VQMYFREKTASATNCNWQAKYNDQ